MGACGKCIKSPIRLLLILFNQIFFVLGVAFIVIGILIKTALTSLLKSQLDPILKLISELPTDFGSSATTAATPSIDFAVILNPVAYILIGFGCVLVCVTFFGCCGACYSIRFMLTIYIILFGAVVIAESVVVGMFFTKKFDSTIRKVVNDNALSKYVDFDDYTAPSLICNFIQLYFDCCGIDNYTDYYSVTTWRRTRTLTILGTSTSYTLTTPVTCCKTNGSFPDVSFSDQLCALNATDQNNNWKTGCWGAIGDRLEKYRSPAVMGIIIVIMVETVFIFLAFIDCCLSKPKDDKSKGNASKGNASQGNTAKDNASTGSTSQGNTAKGNTSTGNTSQGNTAKGNASTGSTSQGNASKGNIDNGYLPNGYVANGYLPNGYTANGYVPRPFAFQRNAFEGNIANGYIANGYTANGYMPRPLRPVSPRGYYYY